MIFILCAMLIVANSVHAALPTIDSQVTFLYYRDVAAAAPFYEKTLGLKKTFDEGWVKIYQISATSYVGLVDETRGYHKVAEKNR